LDFTDTVFLGSAGLAALLNINRLALEKGGLLRLSSCSDDVNQVIKMARFDKVFLIYRDVASAASDPF
jgi:anti-anti-sigma factor